MSEREHAPTEKRNDSSKQLGGLDITWKLVGVFLLVCLAVFLIGFAPMWLRARERTEQRARKFLSSLRHLKESEIDSRLSVGWVKRQSLIESLFREFIVSTVTARRMTLLV